MPPILATKLFVPPPPPQVVSRLRLIERLETNLRQGGGFSKKLTLISAPAGFGKTTLVSAWCAAQSARGAHKNQDAAQRTQIAWLSLDEADNDPARFLSYLVAALQTISPEIGQEVVGALEAPQPPPLETLLTSLVNEISLVPHDIVLVLDDYHVLDSNPVDQALNFLLEHLPPRMHLVITTREDPPLPLPRLRARGQLTEVRAADLRFTPAEAAEFLNTVMGLDLSAPDITALEDRTEGWIAGLQLAALSMRGNQDIPGFIRAFAGDHRYIVDYLVTEVLQQQPEAVRQFLLQTSILDRLKGGLCDFVTGQSEGSARLTALERGNFFVVPLDERREWYRYHHLFGHVLAARLSAEQPEQIPVLHRRASEWFEQNGSMDDAIRHAFAGEQFERAADLIEFTWPTVQKDRQDAMRLDWLKALPEPVLRVRPVLCVAYAHMLLVGGMVAGVEDYLRIAEQWLAPVAHLPAHTDGVAGGMEPEPSPQMVVVDDKAFQNLPGAIGIARAGLALAQGDVTASMRYARETIDLAHENDDITRGGAAGFLGLATWASGDLEGAYQMYATGMASLRNAGNFADTINGAVTLANIRIAQGRLREAMRLYEVGLELAAQQGIPARLVRGTADMYVGMSGLEYEYNALPVALEHLTTSKELGELAAFPQNRYRWRIAMARLVQAQGDWKGALALLHEAERFYISDFSPNVRPIAALIARGWIAQGDIGRALEWARARELSVADELRFDREFELLTLVRLFLAQYGNERSDRLLEDAAGLLARMLPAAQEGGRTGSVIEILMLQALTHQRKGDMPAAFAPLERALALAEPEGYVRLFLDEGESMAQLLRHAGAHKTMPTYAAKLLAAWTADHTGHAQEPSPLAAAPQSLSEPLTEREIEILRLFETEMSGPEIAGKLVIALSTLRTHTKNIYEKLYVNSRRAAVNRAKELGLI